METLSAISILASSAKLAPGNWAGTYFDAIRSQCIGHSSAVSSMAMAIACILIVFNFIKLYYDFVSDEQNGGFGGAKAWDIFRPLIILILIGTFSSWVGLFDSVCSSVSSALISNMNAISAITDSKIEEEIDKIDKELDRKHMSQKDRAHSQALEVTGLSQEQLDASKEIVKDAEKEWRKTKEGKEYNNKMHSLGHMSPEAAATEMQKLNKESQEQMKAFMGEKMWSIYESAKSSVQEFNHQEAEARERMKALGRLSKWIGKGGSLLGKVIAWLFNIVLVLMMVFADVVLCVMAVFGPLTLALSIIPSWKGAFNLWIAKYIEVSMWKPVASAIAWVVLQAKAGVFSAHARLIEGADLSALVNKASITAAIGVEALVLAAGIFALLKAPALTSDILSLSHGMSSAAGGAAALTSAAGGAAGAAAGAAATGGNKGLSYLRNLPGRDGEDSNDTDDYHLYGGGLF